MNHLFRNILTAIWCALVIGTNAFGLILLVRVVGVDGAILDGTWFLSTKLALMAGLGLLSLVSTKFLWAVLGVAVFWMLLGLGYDVLVQRTWRPGAMLSSLFVIVPTYLLARWNAAARKTDFNPVKEF